MIVIEPPLFFRIFAPPYFFMEAGFFTERKNVFSAFEIRFCFDRLEAFFLR